MEPREQDRLRKRLRWENRKLWQLHLLLEKWDRAVDTRASKNLKQLYAMGDEEESTD